MRDRDSVSHMSTSSLGMLTYKYVQLWSKPCAGRVRRMIVTHCSKPKPTLANSSRFLSRRPAICDSGSLVSSRYRPRLLSSRDVPTARCTGTLLWVIAREMWTIGSTFQGFALSIGRHTGSLTVGGLARSQPFRSES